MNVYVATTNQGKLKEIREVFKAEQIDINSLFDSFDGVEDVEETGTTFEENAILKAETYSKQYQVPVIADDSGLEVYALDSEPGVYSARYAGMEKNDQANMDKVLEKLTGQVGDQRAAAFVCVLALAQPGKDPVTTEGRCEGELLTEPKGDQGFGYDPIFKPNGYEQSFAELGQEVKNGMSHRKIALEKMIDYLRKQ